LNYVQAGLQTIKVPTVAVRFLIRSLAGPIQKSTFHSPVILFSVVKGPPQGNQAAFLFEDFVAQLVRASL
jgi:uncharacterized membrane protein